MKSKILQDKIKITKNKLKLRCYPITFLKS